MPTDTARLHAVFDLAMRIGEGLLSNGAAASEVTATVLRVTSSSGLRNVSVQVTFDEVTISYLPDQLSAPFTRVRSASARVQDFSRLAAFEDITHRYIAGDLDLDEARRLAEEIPRQKAAYRLGLVTAGFAMMGGAAALSLGAKPLVATAATLAAGILILSGEYLTRWRIPQFYSQALGGLVGVLTAVVVDMIDPTVNSSIVVVACIIVQLAGLTSFGAMQDAVTGWYITASGRILETLMLTVGVVAGVRGGLLLADRLGADISVSASMPVSLISVLVLVVSGAGMGLGYGVGTQVPARILAWTAVVAVGSAVTSHVLSGLVLDRVYAVAITAFLTGVTEPLEFLFMFLAPLLYLLHAVLTGISLFIATALGIHAGFSFSAGAIDYVLMYSLPAASKNVWMLLVMGVVFFFVYFLLFSAVIRMFNLKTPGREDKAADVVTEEANSNTEEGLTQLATSYIAAVGGTDNLKAIDACITRLRLTVGDSAKVNDAACKRLGASGVVKLNKQTIQVIVGAKAESIGDEMKKVVTRGPVAAAAAAPAGNVATAAPAAKPQAVANAKTVESLVSPITGDVVALEQVPDEAFASKAVGDGIAVKPTSNIVVAPAAGTVVKIFNTNHAFCLETNNGAEIVVHMGIDTVALEGKGFKRLVEEGTDVKAGEPILEMDLDFLNANARSMISPVVCSNSDDYSALVILASGKVVAGQTPLYEIKGK